MVEELDQTVKEYGNAKKTWVEHASHLEHHQKTKSMNYMFRRRKRDTN
jgi:hypothetical protein